MQQIMSSTCKPEAKTTSQIYVIVEAKVVHRKCADGTLVKEELPVCGEKVEVPSYIKDIHPHVVQSGAALMLGMCQMCF